MIARVHRMAAPAPARLGLRHDVDAVHVPLTVAERGRRAFLGHHERPVVARKAEREIALVERAGKDLGRELTQQLGVLAAVDLATGTLAWRHRLPGDYLASPLAANGLAYFTNTEGLTTVMTCDASPRVVAENRLDEAVVASAAAAGGEMYLRTASALYCIRQEPRNP